MPDGEIQFSATQVRACLRTPPDLTPPNAVFRLKNWLRSVALHAVGLIPPQQQLPQQNQADEKIVLTDVRPSVGSAIWWISMVHKALIKQEKPESLHGRAIHILTSGEWREGVPSDATQPDGNVDANDKDESKPDAPPGALVVRDSSGTFVLPFHVVVTFTERAAAVLCDRYAPLSTNEGVREPVKNEAQAMPNALVGVQIHTPNLAPEVQGLLDAINAVECASLLLSNCYQEAVDLHQRRGGPKPDDLPDRAEYRARKAAELIAAEKEAMRQRGEKPEDCGLFVGTTEWADLLPNLVEAYRGFCASVESAIRDVPVVSRIMDGSESRPAERWTSKTLSELRNLIGLIHPVTCGADGMGLVRSGCRPLPAEFGSTLSALSQRRLTLMDVRDVKKPRRKKGLRPVAKKSLQVFRLLASPPAEGFSLASLAKAAGYKSHSSLYNIKDFPEAWQKYEDERRAARARLTPIHQPDVRTDR